MLDVIRRIATSFLIASNSCLKKALPGTTTLAANDRNPTADSSSRCGIVDFLNRSSTVLLTLANLSGGSLACILMLSSSIPRKSATLPMMDFVTLTIKPNSVHKWSKS